MAVSIDGLERHLYRDIGRERRLDQHAQGEAGEVDGDRAWRASRRQDCTKVLVVSVNNTTEVLAKDGELGWGNDGCVKGTGGGDTHVLVDAERVGRHRE